MKKYLPPLFIILLFSTHCFPQIGIKAGLNLSTLYSNSEEISDKQPTLGYQAGLVFGFPISERFSIQPEAVYTRKGAEYDVFQTSVDAAFSYVDVPVLLVFKPQLLQFFRLHIGPQFSWLADVEYEFEDELTNTENEIDSNKDNYSKWDVGIALGAGLHGEKGYAELRLSQGFKSIEKPREIGGIQFGNDSVKNFSLQLSGGFFF